MAMKYIIGRDGFGLQSMHVRGAGLRQTGFTKMTFPRFAHKIYARLFGYAWRTCNRCGSEFGGHEIKHFALTMKIRGRLIYVCPLCARERNLHKLETYRYL
jgi:hypothetical protein